MKNAMVMEDIISRIPENNMIEDGHNNATTKIAGIGIMSDGNIVALFNARYFSLNEVYISKKTGNVRLSPYSVAGVVKPMDFGMNLELAIKAYNGQILKTNADYDMDYPIIEKFHILH